MPLITGKPLKNIFRELGGLHAALDNAIPTTMEGSTLLIATWNLRSFRLLTRKWTASYADSPKRDLRGLRTIIKAISRFEAIALHEVVGNLRTLGDMMHFLADSWSFLTTDITEGAKGNNERIAFVFDRSRVQPSGLAAEIVIPSEWRNELPEDTLVRQFARTPYAVSFLASGQTFILVTLHVEFGQSSTERVRELEDIARWDREWADQSKRWHQSLPALGDFNIYRRGDELWIALTDTGLTVSEDLHNVPRTVFSDTNRPDLQKFYDQIAWFETGSTRRGASLDYAQGRGFDFLPHVYQNTNLSKTSLTWRISDHYPLRVEFRL